jgi:lipoprotein-anchoring transpeptidase ErfK/SrfK
MRGNIVPPDGPSRAGAHGNPVALLPPNLVRTKGLRSPGCFGGFALRVCISLTVIALALAGFVGAATAQYYPPPPPGYEGAAPPPPGYYPPPPPPGYSQPSYSSAPLPPPGAAPPPPNGAPYGYAPPPPPQQESDAYPPPNRPYGEPDSRFPPQPLPALGAPGLRPPAEVGAGAPAGPPGGPSPDITGTVQSPGVAPPPPANRSVIAALPPEDQPEQGPPRQLPPQFQRQLVDYVTSEPAGTIVVDTPHTYLYLIMGHGKALRYGIGVGREGFTWNGTERVSRMKEWPDWFPPKEMIERQPYLPRFMAGGESNPLGARALYLGNTLYRIHGTNQPSTIGSFVSSGCIRLTNQDIEDLYSRVQVGTRVVVLPGSPPADTASAQGPVSH